LEKEKHYLYLDIITALFCVVLVVSNIASSAKIVDWGVSLHGIPLAFDAGTILFPVSYIFGDILTEVYGYKRSRRVIWTGFAALILSSFVFWFINLLPGESTWQQYAGDAAYAAILGGMSTGGIVLASLAGYLSGEFTNSVILAKMKLVTSGRYLWLRTIGSTLFGQLVDTLAFLIVASLFRVFPWSLFTTLFVSNYIFKVSIEVFFTPLTYGVVRWLKRVEQEDFYDRNTDFNPFRA
jgi:uncharacterized integral membrane protein (TIGR00697 family)